MQALVIALLLNATSTATPPVDSDRQLGVTVASQLGGLASIGVVF